MLAHFSILAAIAVAGAHVTFPYSQVFQPDDFFEHANQAFNCQHGCKAFVDQSYTFAYISQGGEVLANFGDIVGPDPTKPQGLELPAGTNYTVYYEHDHKDNFVFYVIVNGAPNYNTPVYAPHMEGIVVADNSRFLSFLSSFNFFDLKFHDFIGTFSSGYPRIYASGFDTISEMYGETNCTPVYQSRSQLNAELTSATVYGPLFTVDFGYIGQHSVTATVIAGSHPPLKADFASTVYMSPGYVGCPFVGSQVYFPTGEPNWIQDSYIMVSNSLDIAATCNDVQPSEAVRLRINQDVLDFHNYSAFARHYGEGAFDVELVWERRTPLSSWAIQIDFGASSTTTTTMTTSTDARTTTSSASSVSVVVVPAAMALIARCL